MGINYSKILFFSLFEFLVAVSSMQQLTAIEIYLLRHFEIEEKLVYNFLGPFEGRNSIFESQILKDFILNLWLKNVNFVPTLPKAISQKPRLILSTIAD